MCLSRPPTCLSGVVYWLMARSLTGLAALMGLASALMDVSSGSSLVQSSRGLNSLVSSSQVERTWGEGGGGEATRGGGETEKGVNSTSVLCCESCIVCRWGWTFISSSQVERT
jgi:hypothetical protein